MDNPATPTTDETLETAASAISNAQPSQPRFARQRLTTPEGPAGWQRAPGVYPLIWARSGPVVGYVLDVDTVAMNDDASPALVLVVREPVEVVDMEDPIPTPFEVPTSSPVRATGIHLLKLRGLSGGAEADAPVALVRIVPVGGRDVVWIAPETEWSTRAAVELLVRNRAG